MSKRPHNREIIYQDMLAADVRLTVTLHDVSEPVRHSYTWRIHFLDETGESYGSANDGQWYESRAAAEAAGRLHFSLEFDGFDDIF